MVELLSQSIMKWQPIGKIVTETNTYKVLRCLSASGKERYRPGKEKKPDLKYDRDRKIYYDEEGRLDHLRKVLIFIPGVTAYINRPVTGSRPRLDHPNLASVHIYLSL